MLARLGSRGPDGTCSFAAGIAGIQILIFLGSGLCGSDFGLATDSDLGLGRGSGWGLDDADRGRTGSGVGAGRGAGLADSGLGSGLIDAGRGGTGTAIGTGFGGSGNALGCGFTLGSGGGEILRSCGCCIGGRLALLPGL